VSAGGEEVGPHLPGAVPTGVGGNEGVRELEGEKAKAPRRSRPQEMKEGEGGGGRGLVGVDRGKPGRAPGAAVAGGHRSPEGGLEPVLPGEDPGPH